MVLMVAEGEGSHGGICLLGVQGSGYGGGRDMVWIDERVCHKGPGVQQHFLRLVSGE